MNLYKHAHVNWALIDQALVSCANFITGIILARHLGLTEFGVYALFFSVLVYANYVQRALVVAPMQIYIPKIENDIEKNHHLAGLLLIQSILSVALSLLCYSIGLLLDIYFPFWSIAENIGFFSVAVFFYLQQDWLRRSHFVVHQAGHAFINDLISYGGQLLVISALLLTDNLSVSSAFIAIALTSCIASIYGMAAGRLTPSFSHADTAFKESWGYGRHLVLAWQVEWLGLHGILLVTGMILGASVAGAIRAAQNIVAPVNIMYMAMENFVPVEASKRASRGGCIGLTSYLSRIGKTGTFLLLFTCLILAIYSEWIIRTIYGPEFAIFSSLVAWQAVIIFLRFYYLLAQFFYRAIGNTKKLLVATLILSFTTIASVMILINSYGADGVMAGVVIGLLASMFYLWRGLATNTQATSS